MRTIRHLILDMDGVLWHGDTPVPGLARFFDALGALDIRFALATNNASRRVDQYVDKLAGFGVRVEPWQVLTSAEVTGAYAADTLPPASSVYVVGDDGLRHALRRRGFQLVNDAVAVTDRADWADRLRSVSAEAVCAGFTRKLVYADVAAATYFIRRGARFIGSNPDRSYPSEVGPLPGAGAILALIEAATDVAPTVIGKPRRAIFDEALKRLGASADTTAMVGDRLETDILGGHAAGLRTILLLSGISSRDAADAYQPAPTFIFDDLETLTAELIDANR